MSADLSIVIKGSDEAQAAFSSAAEGLSGIGAAAESAGGSTGGFFSNMLSTATGFIAANVFSAISGQVSCFVGSILSESMEAEQGQVALALAIKNAGESAAISVEGANALASSYAGLTTYTDDQVLAAEQVLLRYDAIGKDVFPRVTAVSIDMAAALGQSPEAMAALTGKALSSAEGLGQLRKAGVILTDDQETMIKGMYEAGDAAGAQAEILTLLEAKYNGAAEAAGTTLAGQLAIASHGFDDVKQTIGDAFLPILKDLTSALTSPEMMSAIQGIATGLADGIGVAAAWVGEVAIPALTKAWQDLQPAMATISGIVETVIAAFSGAGESSGELGETIDVLKKAWDTAMKAIGEAVEIAKDLIEKAFRAIQTFLDEHGDEIKAIMDKAWNAIQKAIALGVAIIENIIMPAFRGIQTFIDEHGTEIKAVIDTTWTLIKDTIDTTLSLITGIIDVALLAISGDWDGAWAALKKTSAEFVTGLITIFTDLVAQAQAQFNLILPALQSAFDAMLPAAMAIGTDIINAITSGVQNAIGGLTSSISGAVNSALQAGSDALSAGASALGIPGFAEGTDYAPGGLAVVGEHGPELIALPRGSQVKDATDTRSLLAGSGGGGTVINLYYTGAHAEDRDVRGAISTAMLLAG